MSDVRGRQRRGPARFNRPQEDPPGTSRLFLAVPVADDVREVVGRLMEELAGAPIDTRSPGQPRWVRTEGLHLTLRFLGATPDVRVQELSALVEAVAGEVAPFRVELSGGGAFPTPQRPRVLWLGIDAGSTELMEMALRINLELERLGWLPDDRPFNAHLTIARTDGIAGSDERARRLIELGRDLRLDWRADRLVLYKSHAGRGPSQYEALAEAPFSGVR